MQQQREHKVLKSAATYLPSVLVPRLTAFATILFGSHLLSPRQYGYFALVTLIGEVCEMTATNWVRIATIKFGVAQGSLGRPFAVRMAKAAMWTSSAAIAFAAGASFALAPETAVTVGLSVSSYVLANSVLRYGLTLNQILERRRIYAFIEVVRSIAALAVTAAVMRVTRGFLMPSLLGSGVTLVAGVCACIAGLRRTAPAVPDTTGARELRLYAVPLALLSLMSYCVASLDKLLLQSLHDAAALGLYAAAFAVGRQGFDVIASSFNIGGFARLAMLQGEADVDQVQALLRKQMAYILAIALPSAGFLIAARDLVAHVILPPAYLDTFVTAVPFIAVGAIALNIKNFVYDNIFHLRSRNILQLPTLAVGAVVSVAVGLLVIPSNPPLGAAVMFFSGAAAALTVSVWLSSGVLNVLVAWRSMAASASVALTVWLTTQCLRAWLVPQFSNITVLCALAAMATLGVLCAIALASATNAHSEPVARQGHQAVA